MLTGGSAEKWGQSSGGVPGVNKFEVRNGDLKIQGRFRTCLSQTGAKPTLNFEAHFGALFGEAFRRVVARSARISQIGSGPSEAEQT